MVFWMNEKKSIISLIDGDNLYHRNFFQFSNFHNGAIYGFIQSLVRILNAYPTHYLVVCWGGKRADLWRRELYPDYKAHRDEKEPLPAHFSAQWASLKKLLKAMGIIQPYCASFEADDVIAELSKQLMSSSIVLVFTNDKDMLQLVDKNNNLLVIRDEKIKGSNTFREMNYEAVIDFMGVEPDKVPQLLALSGDSSDDIPGVKGIGPKTAAKLLKEFGFERLLTNRITDKSFINNKKLYSIFEKAIDIRLYYSLVDLLNPPRTPKLDIKNMPAPEPDKDAILSILAEYELTNHFDKVKLVVSKLCN